MGFRITLGMRRIENFFRMGYVTKEHSNMTQEKGKQECDKKGGPKVRASWNDHDGLQEYFFASFVNIELCNSFTMF